MSSRTLSIELPEPVFAQVDWQIDDIKAGLREADAGEFATEAEVAAVFARHGA